MKRIDYNDQRQVREKMNTKKEMIEMGAMTDRGPEIPLDEHIAARNKPRTLGEKASVKKERLAQGNPRKGGGFVGKTTRGR